MFKRLTNRAKESTKADLSLWEDRQRQWAKVATTDDLRRALATVATAKFPSTILGAKQRELRRRVISSELLRRVHVDGFRQKYGGNELVRKKVLR